MPTDRSPAPWLPLAETAISRLKKNIAKDGWLAADDFNSVHDAPPALEGLGFKMTRAAARLDPPGHLSAEQIDAIARAGGDPHATDDKGRGRPDIRIPVTKLLLTLRLAATLRSTDGRDRVLAAGAIAVIEIDRTLDPGLLRRALRVLLPEDWSLANGLEDMDRSSLEVHMTPGPDEGKTAAERSTRALMEALSGTSPILIFTDNASALPEAVRRGSDMLRLAPPNVDILLCALCASHSATGAIDMCPVMAALPSDTSLARIDDTALLLAFRAPSAVEVARRVAAAVQTGRDAGPTLADITGMGAAEAQARRMVRDLQNWRAGDVDWRDVERSVIYHGVPGTGKSFLAKAMAGEAGVRLVRGSFAGWQSSGHLGDMLRAMRDSFAEARKSAPSVFIIDEIDAIGSRSDGDRHGQRYHRQVVNGIFRSSTPFPRWKAFSSSAHATT